MRHLILLVSFAAFGLTAAAQHGSVQIVGDERIDLLIEKHKYLCRHQSTLNGWRVQIFFDSGPNSKRKATEALNRFATKYHNEKTYLSFKEPYYRVRVGDFRTRLEAEGFLNSIKADYPNAFTTSDKINPPSALPPEGIE